MFRYFFLGHWFLRAWQFSVLQGSVPLSVRVLGQMAVATSLLLLVMPIAKIVDLLAGKVF